MSKIGKKPVLIPEGVAVKIENPHVAVKGPKGELSMLLSHNIQIQLSDNEAYVQANGSDSATFGRIRSQLANMVTGVTDGWEKTLEVIGTGYRTSTDGKTLTLNIGFSHPVIIAAPVGIEFQVVQNKIMISGVDKMAVGEIAAKIRKVHPPDSYKGKGIRYQGEIVRKKQGKAAKSAGGSA